MTSVVLVGGPRDGEKLSFGTLPIAYYTVDCKAPEVIGGWPPPIGRVQYHKATYLRTSDIRPWPDQTWSWIYRYESTEVEEPVW